MATKPFGTIMYGPNNEEFRVIGNAETKAEFAQGLGIDVKRVKQISSGHEKNMLSSARQGDYLFTDVDNMSKMNGWQYMGDVDFEVLG